MDETKVGTASESSTRQSRDGGKGVPETGSPKGLPDNPYKVPGTIYLLICIYCRSSIGNVLPFARVPFEPCALCGMPTIEIRLAIPPGILKDYTKD